MPSGQSALPPAAALLCAASAPPPPPPVAAARGARRSKPPDPALPGRADLNKNPVEGFSAGLMDESDPFKWEIMIMGPGDTP